MIKNKSKRSVLFLCILLVCTIFLSSCGERESITPETYKSDAEAAGFTVVDVSTQYSKYDYIKTVYIAMDKTKTYQVEFYEASDKEYGSKIFNVNQEIFEKSKGSSSSEASSSGKNYATYGLNTNGKYMYISQIDNTMVYVVCEKKYKADVKKFIDSLGY